MSDAPGESTHNRHEDGLGGHVEILEVGDDTAPTRYRMVLTPGVGPPASEYHPSQAESFHILTGTLDLGTIDGERVLLGPGDRYELAAGVPHLPAAANGEPTEFEAVLTPGLQMHVVFERLFRAQREHKGLGQVARVALTFRAYPETIRLTQPFGTALAGIAGVAQLLRIQP